MNVNYGGMFSFDAPFELNSIKGAFKGENFVVFGENLGEGNVNFTLALSPYTKKKILEPSE